MKYLSWIVATGLVALHFVATASELPYFSEPMQLASLTTSSAADARSYRLDAARHIYASYSPRIYKGRLPPLIHAVVVVESTVGEAGELREVKVVRGPSHAPDVTAAVMEMIRRAGPMPAHSRLAGNVRFTEIWLVHKDGRFQLDALTEGQD